MVNKEEPFDTLGGCCDFQDGFRFLSSALHELSFFFLSLSLSPCLFLPSFILNWLWFDRFPIGLHADFPPNPSNRFQKILPAGIMSLAKSLQLMGFLSFLRSLSLFLSFLLSCRLSVFRLCLWFSPYCVPCDAAVAIRTVTGSPLLNKSSTNPRWFLSESPQSPARTILQFGSDSVRYQKKPSPATQVNQTPIKVRLQYTEYLSMYRCCFRFSADNTGFSIQIRTRLGLTPSLSPLDIIFGMNSLIGIRVAFKSMALKTTCIVIHGKHCALFK